MHFIGRSSRQFLVALHLLAAACATTVAGPRPVAPPLLERHDVSSGPDAVAWSPDGATLAVVGTGGLLLLDLAAGSSRAIGGPAAVAVDWAPATSLLVVERDAAGGRAVAIDPVTGARRVLRSDPDLVAARWLHGGSGWFALASTREVRSYGTQATDVLTVAAGRAPAEAHRWSSVLPTKDTADVAPGWAAVRPNPIDHGLVLPQFRKPPLFRGYVALVALDPFDPDPREVARVELGGWNATVSWSPDGRRAALSARDGSLRIVERGIREARAPAGPARGLHPSWHPGGDVLFLGGALVTAAGAPIRKLLERADDALGFWSPGGDRLAVAAGGRLFVFEQLGVPGPDLEAERRRHAAREALWELGVLRSQGLVAPEVYRERRARLRERAAEMP